MQRLKVVYFTNIPSPYRVAFFNELGKGCELTVLFERRDADDRDSIWLSFDNDKLNFKPVFLKGRKTGADTALCPEVCRYWKDKRYDIRIIGDYATPTGIISVLYMRHHKIRYRIECDGGFIRDDESRLKYLVKKYMISGAEYAYSPARSTDEYLIHYGLPASSIIRYHFSSLTNNDLELAAKERSQRDKYRKELGIDEKTAVLFVGQIIHRKGIDILINAAAKLPDKYSFLIVGGNPTKEYIGMITDKGIRNVRFEGFKQKEELSKYYASADLFCLPTREDIWGLVINEAMSYGLPVITTNKCVAGVEMLESQRLAIMDISNADNLASMIKTVHGQYSETYGDMNMKRSKQYTIECMSDEHLESFERLADK